MVRPMTVDDVAAAEEISADAFHALDLRLRRAADPEPVPAQLLPPGQEPTPPEPDAEEAEEAEDPEEASEPPAEAQAEAEQDNKRKRRLYRAERRALKETIALLQEFRAQMNPEPVVVQASRLPSEQDPECRPEARTTKDQEPQGHA